MVARNGNEGFKRYSIETKVNTETKEVLYKTKEFKEYVPSTLHYEYNTYDAGDVVEEKSTLPNKYVADENEVLSKHTLIEEGVEGKKSRTVISSEYDNVGRVVNTKFTDWVNDATVKPTVYSVGTRPTKVTTVIPYKTIYKALDTLLAGETVKVTDGKVGTSVNTTKYDVNTETGEVYPVKVENELIPAIDELYHVGVKPVEKIINTPYTVLYKETDELYKGEEKVLTEGVNGIDGHKITFTVNEQTGEVSMTVSDRKHVDKIDKVILVGTKEKSVKPTKPSGPVEPNEPAEPIKIDEPVKPAEPIKPTEPVKPVEPIKPTEPVKPVEPIKPTEPVKPVEQRESTEPIKSTKPVNNMMLVKTSAINDRNVVNTLPKTGSNENFVLSMIAVIIGVLGVFTYNLGLKKKKENN